jgi:hypothetical protein
MEDGGEASLAVRKSEIRSAKYETISEEPRRKFRNERVQPLRLFTFLVLEF